MNKIFTRSLMGLCLSLGTYLTSYAQFSYNVISAQNNAGTYTDLGTSGAAITTANNDDANSAAQNIGFTFNYNGSAFTQFVLNTNGFIVLGANPPSAVNIYNINPQGSDSSILASVDPLDANVISAFNHDLTGGAGIEYRVATTGTSPNRVCTIQYKNVMDKDFGTIGHQYDKMNFQIRLYETSNVVEIVFGTWTASIKATMFRSAMSGIKGTDSTEVIRLTKGSTQPWTGAVFTTLVNAGINGMNYGNGSRPAPDAGRTFRFSPQYNNDLKVLQVFAMGSLPKTYGAPQVITARVVNIGKNAMASASATLTISGKNTFSNTKSIPSIASGDSATVTFDGFSPADTGKTDIHVALTNDDDNTNNGYDLSEKVTTNTFGYDSPYQPYALQGIGIGGATAAELVEKFHSSAAAKIDRVRLTFRAKQVKYQIAFYDVDGTTGLPKTLLGVSDTLTTDSATVVVTLKTPVNITGDFFIGLVQDAGQTNSNFGVAYQLEGPQGRKGVNLYRLSYGTGAWTDLAVGGYLFAIDPMIASGVSIRSNEFAGKISVSPNPVNDVLNLSGNMLHPGVMNITITNTIGEMVYSESVNSSSLVKQSINVSNLKSGVYFVNIQSENGNVISKIVKE